MAPGNSGSNHSLLVIDDEHRLCDSLKQLLSSKGFQVFTADCARSGLEVLHRKNIDLVLCDIVMPDMPGLVLLDKIKDIPVIMMTAYASIETTRKAFKRGARDYLVKPFDLEELLVVVNQNLRSRRCHTSKSDGERCFDSHDPSFRAMLGLAEKFSKTDMPILITGESGTGKEVLAKYIHERSQRRNHQIIGINCAAIPETLLESELFGFEKGAFTGASNKKAGKFKDADKGTLFLDEIGDMPMYLQAKILRFLQEFAYYPLGAESPTYVDTRIIAASNQNLLELIEKDRFREDLYHRLNGLHIRIPPLRERKDDMGILIDFFLRRFIEKYGKDIRRLHSKTREMLLKYSWPGNIRELRNCIERSVVVCEAEILLPEHLPDTVHNPEFAADSAVPHEKGMLDFKNEYMRKVILEALGRANGNRHEAARLLNISRKTLYNRMKELSIKYVFE